jgi:hypothetical protein
LSRLRHQRHLIVAQEYSLIFLHTGFANSVNVVQKIVEMAFADFLRRR